MPGRASSPSPSARTRSRRRRRRRGDSAHPEPPGGRPGPDLAPRAMRPGLFAGRAPCGTGRNPSLSSPPPRRIRRRRRGCGGVHPEPPGPGRASSPSPSARTRGRQWPDGVRRAAHPGLFAGHAPCRPDRASSPSSSPPRRRRHRRRRGGGAHPEPPGALQRLFTIALPRPLRRQPGLFAGRSPSPPPSPQRAPGSA